MAQQHESRKTSSRRSLTIARQIASAEGVDPSDLQFGELFRSLPPAFQAQVSRQSNNRRSSNITISSQSVNPTPTASVSKKSSIPIRSGNSSTRKTSQESNVNSKRKTSAASSKKVDFASTLRDGITRKGSKESIGSIKSNASSQPGLISNSSKRPPLPPKTNLLGSTLRHMGSMQSIPKNIQLSTRRSLSIDSLLRDSSGVFTPSMRTPGTSERLSDAGHYVAKSIKPASGKAELDNMAYQIIRCLAKHNIINGVEWTPKQFYDRTANEFINMTKAIGALMVGHEFFEGNADNIAKVLELANILEYPGVISKSHLVSANAPHSRPPVLTFLSWLTSRVEAATTPPTFLNSKPISSMAGNHYDEIVVDSYKTLFFAHLAFQNHLPQNVLEDELQSYRQKVKEMYMSEVQKTIEELQEEKVFCLSKLSEALSTRSPAQSLLDAKKMYEGSVKELKEKIETANKQWNAYKDLTSLQAKSKAHHSKLDELKNEIKELKRIVERQPINKTKQLSMLDEIKVFQNQVTTINKMANKLSQDLRSKTLQTDNVGKMYYDVCAKFTVVEEFKEVVRVLHWNLPEVPPMPLEPKDFSNWVKEVSKIQADSKAKCSEMQKHVTAELTKLERNRTHLEATINNLCNEIARYEETVTKSQQLAGENIKKFEFDAEKVNKNIENGKGEVAEITRVLQEMQLLNSNLEAEASTLKAELEKAENEQQTWTTKCENYALFLIQEQVDIDVNLHKMYLDLCQKILDVEAKHSMEGKASLLTLAKIQDAFPPPPPPS